MGTDDRNVCDLMRERQHKYSAAPEPVGGFSDRLGSAYLYLIRLILPAGTN